MDQLTEEEFIKILMVVYEIDMFKSIIESTTASETERKEAAEFLQEAENDLVKVTTDIFMSIR